MKDCNCICAIHRSFTTVQCLGARETAVVMIGWVSGSYEVNMCKPCARWWEESQTMRASHTPARQIPHFDAAALYQAIADEVQTRRITSARQVLREAGIADPSTLTRLKRGGGPNAQNLVRLMRWLGRTDLDPFIRYEDAP